MRVNSSFFHTVRYLFENFSSNHTPENWLIMLLHMHGFLSLGGISEMFLSGQEPAGSGRFLVLQILFFFHFQPFFKFIVLKGPNGS